MMTVTDAQTSCVSRETALKVTRTVNDLLTADMPLPYTRYGEQDVQTVLNTYSAMLSSGKTFTLNEIEQNARRPIELVAATVSAVHNLMMTSIIPEFEVFRAGIAPMMTATPTASATTSNDAQRSAESVPAADTAPSPATSKEETGRGGIAVRLALGVGLFAVIIATVYKMTRP